MLYISKEYENLLPHSTVNISETKPDTWKPNPSDMKTPESVHDLTKTDHCEKQHCNLSSVLRIGGQVQQTMQQCSFSQSRVMIWLRTSAASD